MSLNNDLINTALLGTANKELAVSDFPDELQKPFMQIKEKANDVEAAFYQMAALGFAYSRAGIVPQKSAETTQLGEATADEAAYFSHQSGELLLSLANERNQYLLLYAYRRASVEERLIHPRFLQPLLSRAFERTNPHRREEQQLLSGLVGNRGRWLLPLMGLPTWNAKSEITWETASHEERKSLLLDVRRENTDEGLALLRTEWKNDSAAHREELIQCLREKLNKNDEVFLREVMATDRSSNVKDTARRLLDSLPDSSEVNYYWSLLKGKLRYNMLLGWSYDKVEFTPELKKMGFEEVSSVKQEKDDRFLLRQLAERVPLAFWCEFYDCAPDKAAAKLAKNPPFQRLFEIWRPIELFTDSLWAYHTLKERTDGAVLKALMGMLTPAQREEIAFDPAEDKSSIPNSWFNNDGEPWGIKFSTRVFQRLLLSSYYVSKEEIERIAIYFPKEMLPLIQKKMASLSSEDTIAIRCCHLLLDYMELKLRIDTIFNDHN